MKDGNIFECENLSISFGGLKAVDNLTFNVGEKEILGLIGPNGAGKTTVFNCITQFYNPDEGSLRFRARDGKIHELTENKVDEIIGLGLVRTFQNIEVVRELSVLENVLVGAHAYFKSGLVKQLFHLKSAREEEAYYRQKAMDSLAFLGIADKAYQFAGGQPYGVLKKIEIARALMCDPKLLILDEPVAGLNDAETAEMIDTIHRIRDEYECSIILVEHNMKLVMSLCHRICAINFGKLLALGSPEEIQNNKDVQEAYLGASDE